MKKEYDYVIVGGGIIGVATAYKLALRCPEKTILILEKETQLASHQTGNNSGVIHSGIYYSPGSRKAENCRIGREQLVTFSKSNNIEHQICGKVIVATNKSEIGVLEAIFEKGLQKILKKKFVNVPNILIAK